MDSDIVKIYNKLREHYPVHLNSSLAVSSNFRNDFPILSGTSGLGKFEVFFDGFSYPFYAMQEDDEEVYDHWHLRTPDAVERAVVDFMSNKARNILF